MIRLRDDISRVSECCGAHDGAISLDGPNWSDIHICPDCRDHCEFVEEEEEEEHDCCESKERGFGCECYKRGPTKRSMDEDDERGDWEYHDRKDRGLI